MAADSGSSDTPFYLSIPQNRFRACVEHCMWMSHPILTWNLFKARNLPKIICEKVKFSNSDFLQ